MASYVRRHQRWNARGLKNAERLERWWNLEEILARPIRHDLRAFAVRPPLPLTNRRKRDRCGGGPAATIFGMQIAS